MTAAPNRIQKGVRRGGVALLALIALSLAGSRPAKALSFSDDFSGSALMPLWETYLPKKEATAQLTASHVLEIETPKNGNYDHWTSVDQAPQVRMDAPDGDFTIQTRLSLPGSPEGSYHAGLFVMFGKNDLCLWGPYQSVTTIKMERSGTGYSQRNVSYSPIDLRLRKVGTAYHFEYKSVSGANWVSAQTITVTDKPIKVGLMAKTWAPLDVKADFYNFALEGDGFRIDLTNRGWIRATITDGTNLVSGPWLIVRDTSGKQVGGVAKAATNGRAVIFNVPAGTYSVKSVHPHYDSSETETATVTAGQETALNLTVVPARTGISSMDRRTCRRRERPPDGAFFRARRVVPASTR